MPSRKQKKKQPPDSRPGGPRVADHMIRVNEETYTLARAVRAALDKRISEMPEQPALWGHSTPPMKDVVHLALEVLAERLGVSHLEKRMGQIRFQLEDV